MNRPEVRPAAGLLLCLLFAVATTALLAMYIWPGFMSFDSFFAYRQSIEGVQTAVWPPMHDYLFYLSRVLAGGPGGLFVMQCLPLFFFANRIIDSSIASRAAAAVAMAAFVGLFVLFPTLLGTVIVLWKDVAVATFSVAAIALWCSLVQRFSWLRFLGIFVLLTVAISLRYNALPLVLPFMALVAIDPAGDATDRRKRLLAVFGAGMVVAVSYATTLWRLPDFQRLPPVGGMVTTIKLWDIAGVSACARKNLLPDSIDPAPRIVGSAFAQMYDPRHANLMFDSAAWKEHVAGRAQLDPDAVDKRWRQLLLSRTGCYLAARNAVFREQFGLHAHAVHYPTHGGIDENPYGIRLAFPERAAVLIQTIVDASNHPLRRAYVLHASALVLVVLAGALNRRRFGLPIAMALGVAGFVALLYVVAPAADARYVFPSSVFSALLIVLCAGRIGEWCLAKARAGVVESVS
jgi:hypothetical protein